MSLFTKEQEKALEETFMRYTTKADMNRFKENPVTFAKDAQPTFPSQELSDNIKKQMEFINANKEYLVRAFLAETGLKPSECELITRVTYDPNGSTTHTSIRKKAT
jgi:hypothetical protein